MMKQTTFSLLFLFFSATFTLAQVTTWNWDEAPPEDLLGNRGEIAKTIQTSTDESKLLEIWQRPEVEEGVLYLKMLAAKRLGVYGTKAAVPVLTARLDNDKDGFYARYALETIPGTEVDTALCEALKKIETPSTLAGILTTLGVRGNSVSAEAVKPLLTHKNADVRKAAGYAYALTAKENDGTAFFGNKNLDPLLIDSGFLFAERCIQKGNANQATKVYDALSTAANAKEYQKMAALYQGALSRGLDGAAWLYKQITPNSARHLFEVGLKAGRELPADAGATVAKTMIGQLDAQSDPLQKAKQVRAIGDRKDKESKAVALPVITKLAQSGDVAVRVAAIDALCNIGNASVLPVLIEAVTQTEEKQIADAAQNTLIGLPGSEIDAAISAALEKGGTPAVKVALMSIIAERRIFSASPVLLKMLKDSDAAVSGAAISALGQISGIEDLPMLLGLLRGASSEAEAKTFLGVLKSACTRFPQEAAATEVAKVLEGSPATTKTQLLDLLKEIAGAKALSIVESYAWGSDAAMRNVATRILGEWRSPPDLDQLAAACLKLAKESDEYKIRGLRGYIRLARQFDMPEDRRLSMCKEVFDLAERNDEKNLIFDVYARQTSVKALEQTAAYFDNPDFSEKAVETAIVIGKKLQGRQPQAAKIMEDAVKKTKNAETRSQAEAVRSKLAGVDEGVEIVKAIYGAGNSTADVTAKVQAASGGSTLIELGNYNDAFGDVAPQVVKTLKITYKIKGGQEKTVEFPENAPIALPQ